LKTLLQLVIAAVVIVACARGGEAAWRHYQLRDAVEQEVRFGNAKTTSELRQRVLALAAQHDVELEAENVSVEAQTGRTVVTVTYAESIELVPALYTREHTFEFNVSIPVVRPLLVDER
jgi:hypothetical protein